MTAKTTTQVGNRGNILTSLNIKKVNKRLQDFKL